MKKRTVRCDLNPMEINIYADRLLERCARGRLGLKATMDVFLPKAAAKFRAAGAAVETLNEDLKRETFWHGTEPAFELAGAPGRLHVTVSRGLRWISRPLDLDGRRVGTLAFAYRGDAAPDAEYGRRLEALCEELDNVLWGVQSASVKQKLVEKVTRCLTRSVLREALDEAVGALYAEIPFRRLGVVYRNEDDTDAAGVQYRVYRGRRCIFDTELKPHKVLDKALHAHGAGLLAPERHAIRDLLGMKGGVSFVLSAQVAGTGRLGKLVVEVDGGLSSFGRDLMHVFANSISQRLIDYNRERRHMAKFFPPDTVSELLRDPRYMRNHLSPRVKEVAILYADINSFTKLCENALRNPDQIGGFVDHWSAEAVRIAWANGGVFDKMVGDCVIALFGPPFYRRSPAECAAAALKAAREIQAFTARLGRLPRYRGLAGKIKARGLGVGVGVNLCPAAVGLFGPNQDFTAFSSGMNQTARLQSKAGFREVLVMARAKEALEKARLAKKLRFEGPFEAAAKNVAKPLRYFRLKAR